jgi:hypothetical protein
MSDTIKTFIETLNQLSNIEFYLAIKTIVKHEPSFQQLADIKELLFQIGEADLLDKYPVFANHLNKIDSLDKFVELLDEIGADWHDSLYEDVSNVIFNHLDNAVCNFNIPQFLDNN